MSVGSNVLLELLHRKCFQIAIPRNSGVCPALQERFLQPWGLTPGFMLALAHCHGTPVLSLLLRVFMLTLNFTFLSLEISPFPSLWCVLCIHNVLYTRKGIILVCHFHLQGFEHKTFLLELGQYFI